MNEFLAFRKFITPVFIQVIFWIAVAMSTISALTIMFQGGLMIFAGLVFLVVGPFVARIYCELLILLFRIYDELVAMRTGSAPGGFPVVPLPSATPNPAPINPPTT